MNTINDLYPFTVNPFTKKEAKQLIKKLIKSSDLVINTEQQDFIIEKIEWLIPFLFK